MAFSREAWGQGDDDTGCRRLRVWRSWTGDGVGGAAAENISCCGWQRARPRQHATLAPLNCRPAASRNTRPKSYGAQRLPAGNACGRCRSRAADSSNLATRLALALGAAKSGSHRRIALERSRSADARCSRGGIKKDSTEVTLLTTSANVRSSCCVTELAFVGPQKQFTKIGRKVVEFFAWLKTLCAWASSERARIQNCGTFPASGPERR